MLIGAEEEGFSSFMNNRNMILINYYLLYLKKNMAMTQSHIMFYKQRFPTTGNSQCSAVHELPTIAVENKLRNCNVCEEEFLKKMSEFGKAMLN